MARSQEVAFGVHSEVGTLRKVLVCAPGLAHMRLTPTNCDRLLFDEIPWVQSAKRDHFDFVTKMRERGVEVVEMHELLAETLDNPVAKKWLLDNQITANEVGMGLVAEIRAFLEGLSSKTLAEFMIGGVSTEDLPDKQSASDYMQMVHEAAGAAEYLLPPLPNTLYTRDTTSWFYGGVTLNPLYWPVRREETLLTTAIYRFHPSFSGKVNVWWGDPEKHFGQATVEGGGRAGPGQGGRPHRHERADVAPRDHPAGRRLVRKTGGDARHRRRHAQAAGGDAPGHRVHLLRPRRGQPVPADRQSDQDLLPAPGRRADRPGDHE
jgi:arginine deiminase